MMSMKMRLAIVGSGQISDRFIKQAMALDGVDMVAVSSKHLANAKAKAESYGIKAWYDDYSKMMNEEKPDGVIVATPHSVHAEVALAALSQGISALVDKPMATTFADCQVMVDTAKSSGSQLMVLPFDLYPNILAALPYLSEEYIGKFTGAEAQLSLPGPGRDNWYYNKEISHGGAILDCLVYPVSRLVSLLGPVKSVTAMVNTIIPNRIVNNGVKITSDVDDNATLILEYATGQHAVVRTLWGMAFVQNNTIVYGRKGSVAIGDAGYPSLVVHSPSMPVDGQELTWRGQTGCYAPSLPEMKIEDDIVGRFVESIRTNTPAACSGEFQLHVHEILFGAYQSADTGQVYQMTTSVVPWYRLPQSIYDTRSTFI